MVPITDRCLCCAMCQALFLKVDSSLYFVWGGIYDDQFLPTLFDKSDDATICLKFCLRILCVVSQIIYRVCNKICVSCYPTNDVITWRTNCFSTNVMEKNDWWTLKCSLSTPNMPTTNHANSVIKMLVCYPHLFTIANLMCWIDTLGLRPVHVRYFEV